MKFKILQLKKDVELRYYRWEALEDLYSYGLKVELKNYKTVYEGSLEGVEGNVLELLSKVFYIFNQERPSDFKGHSLSMSDIVEVDGEYYYCDRNKWTKLNENEIGLLRA